MDDIDVTTDSRFRTLDPRVILLDRVVGWITTAVMSGMLAFGVMLALMAGDGLASWMRLALVVAWLTIAAALAWFGQYWPAVAFAHTRYRVDDQGIEIHRGVYWRDVINVPRSRVQHTDVTQGPIDRRFGLGTLVIYTAGTAFARVELSGLEHGDALRIRTYLLPGTTPDAV